MKEEFISRLAGYFWLQISYEVAAKVLAGAVPSEGLAGLEDPLPRWSLVQLLRMPQFPHWLLMKSLNFPSCGPLHRVLEYPHNAAAGFPQFKWIKKCANGRTTVSFISWPWKSQIVFSTISYWLCRWVPFSIAVNYTRTWKPGSGNPCGPSWKLATTVR